MDSLLGITVRRFGFSETLRIELNIRNKESLLYQILIGFLESLLIHILSRLFLDLVVIRGALGPMRYDLEQIVAVINLCRGCHFSFGE